MLGTRLIIDWERRGRVAQNAPGPSFFLEAQAMMFLRTAQTTVRIQRSLNWYISAGIIMSEQIIEYFPV
jgi:hypothetical protein